jgi:sugar diacid utilization regulator
VHTGVIGEGEDRDHDRALLALAVDLGYDLAGEHLGVIATGAGAEEVLRDLARRLDRRLLSLPRGEGIVWAWLGGRRALRIGDFVDALAAADAPVGVCVAAGEPAHGLAGWRLTYRQAQAALLVASREPRPLTCYGEVALLASVLKDVVLGRSLVEIYLTPLADAGSDGRVLRRTLHAYFVAERNASSAAAALGVARKTVESRLHTIEARLGYPLRTCPPELEVALRLDELNIDAGVDGSSRESDFTQPVK